MPKKQKQTLQKCYGNLYKINKVLYNLYITHSKMGEKRSFFFISFHGICVKIQNEGVLRNYRGEKVYEKSQVEESRFGSSCYSFGRKHGGCRQQPTHRVRSFNWKGELRRRQTQRRSRCSLTNTAERSERRTSTITGSSI